MAEEKNSEMTCLNMSAIKCIYSMIQSNGGDGDKFNNVVGGICEYYGIKKVKVNQVLLITLDYDACGAILTMLFEDNFPNKVSCLRKRFEMQDHYHNYGAVETSLEIARNLFDDIKERVNSFKEKYPDGKVIGLNGSYRQDCEIDDFNRENHNNIEKVGFDYYIYNNAFKGVIPSGTNSLVCIEDGDFDCIFKLLDIEYLPQLYADGDGAPGCCRGNINMTVYNNRPKILRNAEGKRIKAHRENKKGLVEAHFAKIENRFPNANIEMVFYDDVVKYLCSISKVKRKENWSLKTIHFDGWCDSEQPIPIEITFK